MKTLKDLQEMMHDSPKMTHKDWSEKHSTPKSKVLKNMTVTSSRMNHRELKKGLSASLEKHSPSGEKSNPSMHMKSLYKKEKEQSERRIKARQSILRERKEK